MNRTDLNRTTKRAAKFKIEREKKEKKKKRGQAK